MGIGSALHQPEPEPPVETKSLHDELPPELRDQFDKDWSTSTEQLLAAPGA